MTALETVLQPEPIRGWRAWRVLSIATLRDGPQLRLCAVGTRGIPKVWEPRQSARAVCSDHTSAHEAPNPDHECGLYGLRSRARLDKLVEDWTRLRQGGETIVAWAVGLVTLTGRVVEFELGWRAEFAYPYAITVHAEDDSIARELRQLYAVDVDRAPAFPEPPPIDTDELEDVADELEDLEDKIRALKARTGLSRPRRAPVQERRIPASVTWRDAVKSVIYDFPWTGDVVASSRDVAEKLARPLDPNLPLDAAGVDGVGVMLARAHELGEVVKVRHGQRVGWMRPRAAARMTAETRAYWEPAPRRFAAFDKKVLAAVRAADEPVPARKVVELLRLEPGRSSLCRVAQALARLVDTDRVERSPDDFLSYIVRRLVFDDEQVVAALAEVVARSAATREPDSWMRGTATSSDVADVLAGLPTWFEVCDGPTMSEEENAEYRRRQPKRHDVQAVGRTLRRLANEGRVVRFARAATTVRWAPEGTRDEDVDEMIARLSKPLVKTATTEAVETTLRALNGDGSWIAFGDLFRALEPPDGREAKRFMGSVSMRLAQLRRAGVVEGERVEGVNCWRVVGAEKEGRA